MTINKRIFISHGHDQASMLELKGFLRDRLKLAPLVLSEQPDDGLTVVEKLERYGSDARFALVLLTADDVTADGGVRARQNVVHELGYFHGLLGRRNVLLLKEEHVELFSNISGLIYKEFPQGKIKTIFEDVRLALESGDLAEHAMTVPPQEEPDESRFTEADVMTAALVGGDKAIVELKEIAAQFSGSDVASAEAIATSMTKRIDDLRREHEEGGETDHARLEAAIAGTVSDYLRRIRGEFTWRVEEDPAISPKDQLRTVIKEFIEEEEGRFK